MNNQIFNNNIYKIVDSCKPNTDGNTIISGVSIKMALSMLLNGALNKSESELSSFLGKSVEEINKETKDLIDSCGDYLKLANAFWFNIPNEINESFESVIKEYQNAHIYVDDFSSPLTLNKINNWVKDNTKGLIENVLDILTGQSVLINTLYFKANWDEAFPDYLTKNELFNGLDNKSEVQMMHNTVSNYFENDYAKGVSLTYSSCPYQFIAVLPNKEGEFNIEQLDLNNFNQKGGEYSVDLSFPKLDIDFKTNIEEILPLLGVKAPFENASDFTKMLSIPQMVSQIIHKTKLKLDENGTEAAAVTAVTLREMACFVEEEPIKINLVFNRPFAFIIKNYQTNDLLFVGKINNL